MPETHQGRRDEIRPVVHHLQHTARLAEIQLRMRSELHGRGDVGAQHQLHSGIHSVQEQRPGHRLGLRRVARHAEAHRVQRFGVLVAAADVGRHGGQPSRQRRGAPPLVDLPAPSEDERERAVPRTGAQEEVDGDRAVALGDEPIGGAPQEDLFCARILRAQAIAQNVADEVMEPVPTGRALHGRDEQRLPHERAEELLPAADLVEIAAAAEGLGEGPGQLVDDRQAQQCAAATVGQGGEHLLGEVVDDETVALGEGVGEGIRVGSTPEAQTQTGELDAGRPPLGPLADRPHRADRHGLSSDGIEHAGGLDVVEREIGLADLDERMLEAVGAPSASRVDPGRDDHVRVGRQSLGETPQIVGDLAARQQVQVVEDQNDLPLVLRQRHHERVDESDAESSSRLAERSGEIGERRVLRPETRDESLREMGGIGIRGGEVVPGDAQIGTAVHPLREEHRLPRARRRDQQGQRRARTHVEASPQPRSVHRVRRGRMRIGHRGPSEFPLLVGGIIPHG
ncbi:hypothetical protein [Microbacterium aurantiacum]|uniref:hypothetical protein n=1 Tax=Microbacterium aurantiacum TaxID=162393 RepID=UPI003444A4AF